MEYEFASLMKVKQRHSKMDNLNYSKLDMQQYLKLENIDKNSAQTLFRFRVRMAKFGENFRKHSVPVVCPLCELHLDNQVMGFENCQVVRNSIKIDGNYPDIFKTNIPSGLVKTLVDIEDLREKLTN